MIQNKPSRTDFLSTSNSKLLLLVGFLLLAFSIYWPALEGPLISDDVIYIAFHPWTAELSSDRVLAILDPTSDVRFQQANYAPFHLIATAIEKLSFGEWLPGYHAINISLHAVNAFLLVLLLISSGLPALAALVGGLFFLLHPANVEAVAWISQLKTDGAMTLSLLAILAFRRHPAIAALLFLSALLFKASASFVLPMVAAMTWVRGRPNTPNLKGWAWVGVLAVIFALYSIPQFSAFSPRGGTTVEAFSDFMTHVRTIASIGLHYLVMAATSWGVAHAAEHPPVLDAMNPWWLCSIPVGLLLMWRVVLTTLRRKEESIYWIGAMAAFGPVSQIFPFSHPIGDRYLYFILPGLIGGTLLLLNAQGNAFSEWLASHGRSWPSRRTITQAALVVIIPTLVVFAAISTQRAALWADMTLLEVDSAQAFPGGRSDMILQARRAAYSGDSAGAVLALNQAADLGRNMFQSMLFDPSLTSLHNDPGFRALIEGLAGRYIELIETRSRPTPAELREVSVAHFERGEYALAESALQRAIDQAAKRNSIIREQFEVELQMLRLLVSEISRPR